MTKLKTLKDIGDYIKSVRREDVKKEAIKWVKMFNDGKDCGKTCSLYKGGDCELSCYDMEVFIKHFFNITSEDLK